MFITLVLFHIFMHEGSCLPLGTFPKNALRIINKLAQLINQLTQVFHNTGSFVYADLNLSMKATIAL